MASEKIQCPLCGAEVSCHLDGVVQFVDPGFEAIVSHVWHHHMIRKSGRVYYIGCPCGERVTYFQDMRDHLAPAIGDADDKSEALRRHVMAGRLVNGV